MTFELGQTYGAYQFIDVVDSSRNGVTYRVRNLEENRFELLRVLPKAMQEDPERVERFFREAKVRARLSHRNIVSFFHATLLEGQFVMTTEVVEGRTLADRLELGPMSSAEAAEAATQLLSALHLAHQNGVVHRDVSATNLLIAPEGHVKLTGFSFARVSTDPRLTQVGAALGEVHYMSPEQVRGVDEPDARTDIYSAGILLYEMLTGRRPFDAASQFDIMLAHVNTPPVPPSRLNPAVAAEFDAVVLRALAKNPAHRFQTAAEFREALLAPGELPAASEPAVEPERHWNAPQWNAPPVPGPLPPPPPEIMTAPPAALEANLPEMRIGPRELAVLGLGVVAMVTLVMLVTR